MALDALFTLAVVFMVSKRLSAMVMEDFDPYSAGEGAVCSLLFGSAEEAGARDAMTKPSPAAAAAPKVRKDDSN